jgi:uncharacterized phage infection (PIP) family protein YhgE
MNNHRTTFLGSVLLLAGAAALGSLGLTAGASNAMAADRKATEPKSAEAQAQQAQAEQELAARQRQLADAKSSIAQLEASANKLPMKDEQLDSMLSQLNAAVSKAEGNLSGDQGQAALNNVEQLSKEASARLATLQKQEQEARQALQEQYQKVVADGQKLAPGLVRGFDGAIYLGYRPSAVEKAQRALEGEGYYSGPANGDLDEATRVAIARFQEVHGLAVTGIPTPYTRAELEGSPSSHA